MSSVRFEMCCCILLGSVFILPEQKTYAQTCNYFAGKAMGKQSVNVDLCSISRASSNSVDFVYYLGTERVDSQANCLDGGWTTLPERALQRPQSKATQKMLDVVCSYKSSAQNRNSKLKAKIQGAVIFDPPSNIRTSPNGEILCSIKNTKSISIYGSIGSWDYTDVCGDMGVIHSSQIRF